MNETRLIDADPDELERLAMEESVRSLIARAESRSLVVTVTQQPLKPLAMGNHTTVVDVRFARKRSQ